MNEALKAMESIETENICVVGVKNSTLELSTARNGVDGERAIDTRGDCRNSSDSHNK